MKNNDVSNRQDARTFSLLIFWNGSTCFVW